MNMSTTNILSLLYNLSTRQDKRKKLLDAHVWKDFWAMKDLVEGKLPLPVRKLMNVRILTVLTVLKLSLQSSEVRTRMWQLDMELIVYGTVYCAPKHYLIVNVGHEATSLRWTGSDTSAACQRIKKLKIPTEWIPANVRRRLGRPKWRMTS